MLSDNYQDVVRPEGVNYFLGVKLNENKIEHAYVCGIESGTFFCIEGAVDDYVSNDPETTAAIFWANRGVLNNIYNSEQCSGDDSNFSCTGTFSASDELNDNTSMHDSNGWCEAMTMGILRCSQW